MLDVPLEQYERKMSFSEKFTILRVRVLYSDEVLISIPKERELTTDL